MAPTEHPKGWIGFDLDATLADYSAGWQGVETVGRPVPSMAALLRDLETAGYEIRIFTARVWPLNDVVTSENLASVEWRARMVAARPADLVRVEEARLAAETIFAWCREHFRKEYPVTNVKDLRMLEMYDDRAVQVRPNTGVLVGQPRYAPEGKQS